MFVAEKWKKIKSAKEKITSLTSSSLDVPQKALASVLPLPRKEEVTIGFLSRHICFYLGGAPSEKCPFRVISSNPLSPACAIPASLPRGHS